MHRRRAVNSRLEKMTMAERRTAATDSPAPWPSQRASKPSIRN